MLILARRLEQSLVIGDGIEIKIVAVQGTGEQATVRLGIEAPPDVRIWRKEVYDQVVAENRQALAVAGSAVAGPALPAAAGELAAPGGAGNGASSLLGLVLRPIAPTDKS